MRHACLRRASFHWGRGMSELIFLMIALLISGLAAGVMAGLLGVGGGLIMVPVLFQCFIFLGIPEALQMHLAVGTSLAIITITSVQSFRAHARTGAVDFDTLKLWALPIMLGATAGAIIVRMISADGLKAIFAVIVLILGLRILFLPDQPDAARRGVPRLVQMIAASTIGFFSALMGIGGGTFSVPLLTFTGKTMHVAVATSAGIGFFIALPATLGFVWSGWDAADLPAYSLGYVSGLAFLIMIPATSYGAPIGVRLAHRLDKKVLQTIFGGFLLLMSARMFYAWLA